MILRRNERKKERVKLKRKRIVKTEKKKRNGEKRGAGRESSCNFRTLKDYLDL